MHLREHTSDFTTDKKITFYKNCLNFLGFWVCWDFEFVGILSVRDFEFVEILSLSGFWVCRDFERSRFRDSEFCRGSYNIIFLYNSLLWKLISQIFHASFFRFVRFFVTRGGLKSWKIALRNMWTSPKTNQFCRVRLIERLPYLQSKNYTHI